MPAHLHLHFYLHLNLIRLPIQLPRAITTLTKLPFPQAIPITFSLTIGAGVTTLTAHASEFSEAINSHDDNNTAYNNQNDAHDID